MLVLTGAGFDSTTTPSLVAADGTTYPANQVIVVSSTELMASFYSGTVPLGVYSVQVTKPSGAIACVAKRIHARGRR